MMVIETGSTQFDPTPEELHKRAVDQWHEQQAAYDVEQQGVAERVGQLEIRLRSLDQSIAGSTGHASAVFQIERVSIAERLEHSRARVIHIDKLISTHRRAKP